MDSIIRIKAKSISFKMYSLIRPHTSPILLKLVDWFFNNHILTILDKKTDDELKKYLKDGFDELKPLFLETKLAYDLVEAKKLNDPSITTKLMKMPDFEKAMELVDSVL